MFKLRPARRESKDDAVLAEYNEDVELFEKHEFPIFLEEMSEFETIEDTLSALHFISQFGYHGIMSYRGWTPVEIAAKLYESNDIVFAYKFLFTNGRKMPDGSEQSWRDYAKEMKNENAVFA